MPYRTIAYATVLVCLVPRIANAGQDASLEIRAAEEQLAAALIAKDAAAFERRLAPEFVLRGAPDVERATWIANALNLCWGTEALISDFRLIEQRDDMAVAGLVLTTNRDPETCERATVRSLLTDLWQRRNGVWQLVLRHSGPAGSLGAQFTRAAAPPPRWEGSSELSLVDTGGNSDTQTLGLAGGLTWRPGVWTTDARVSFVRSTTASIATARSLVTTVRQARQITTRVDAFGRFELLVNEFAGIDDRVSMDAGLGWRLLEGGPHTLRADVGLGWSRERRLTGASLAFSLVNAGAVYQWRIANAAAIADTVLVTASLEEGEDWRLGNSLTFTTAITRGLSVKLGHELRFANRPVPGFERTDTVFSAGVVVRF